MSPFPELIQSNLLSFHWPLLPEPKPSHSTSLSEEYVKSLSTESCSDFCLFSNLSSGLASQQLSLGVWQYSTKTQVNRVMLYMLKWHHLLMMSQCHSPSCGANFHLFYIILVENSSHMDNSVHLWIYMLICPLKIYIVVQNICKFGPGITCFVPSINIYRIPIMFQMPLEGLDIQE